MGSAASIETPAAAGTGTGSSSPAAQTVLEAVRSFHGALLRLAQYATNGGQEQDFLKSHAKADLTSLLSGFTPPAPAPGLGLDYEVVDVALDLGTNALGALLQLATTSATATTVAKEEMPEGPLRNFLPISLVPDVVKVVDAAPMLSKEGQRDFATQRNGNGHGNGNGNGNGNKQSAKDLRAAVADLSAAMRTAVVERCCEVENIAKTCHEVVDAANADFRPVYESVWHRVEENEKVHLGQYREVAAGMAFPLANQAVQTAKDPVELLEHGARVQQKYRRIIGELVFDVSGAKAKIPTVSGRRCLHLWLALALLYKQLFSCTNKLT